MKASPFCLPALVLYLVMLTASAVRAGEPRLTAEQAIAAVTAIYPEWKNRSDDFEPPTATYEPEPDRWRVHYQDKAHRPGGFMQFFVNDKTSAVQPCPPP